MRGSSANFVDYKQLRAEGSEVGYGRLRLSSLGNIHQSDKTLCTVVRLIRRRKYAARGDPAGPGGRGPGPTVAVMVWVSRVNICCFLLRRLPRMFFVFMKRWLNVDGFFTPNMQILKLKTGLAGNCWFFAGSFWFYVVVVLFRRGLGVTFKCLSAYVSRMSFEFLCNYFA